MGTVGTAESVGRLTLQLVIYSLEIALGQNYIRVEHYQVFTCSTLGTVVAALPGTGIVFHEVSDVYLVGILVAHILTRPLGTILHDDYLEVLQRLTDKARQKLVNLVGTVEYGDDNRILQFSLYLIIYMRITPSRG